MMDIVGEIRGAHWNDKVAREAIAEIKRLRQQNAELVKVLWQLYNLHFDEMLDRERGDWTYNILLKELTKIKALEQK